MRNIPEKETLTVEFKSDKKRLKDSVLVDAVVGMSNTEGGDIYHGVEDDGTITGLHPNHEDAAGLAAMIANKTVPPVITKTDLLKESGKSIMDIAVAPSDTLISTSEGKVLKRRLKIDGTPETSPMYPNEMNSRLSSVCQLDFSAQVVPGSDYSDFDPIQRMRVRQMIQRNHGDQILLTLSDEDFDQALGLVKKVSEEWIPTIAGLLILGTGESLRKLLPTAKAAFQVVFNGNIVQNEDYIRPIPELIEIFEKNLQPWNPQTEMESGMVRIGIPSFDPQAFREAVTNAFCHRDYAALGEVRILIDDAGLSINNPGGFVDGIQLDNLLTTPPKGRNPLLSDILKRIGLTERTGRGIDKIFAGSWKYGKTAPDYSETTKSGVTLFIPRGKPDIPFIRMLEEAREQNAYPSLFGLFILNILRTEGSVSEAALIRETGFSKARIQSYLLALQDSDLIRFSSGKYSLNADRIRTETSKLPVDPVQNILALFQSQPELQRQDICRSLGLSSSQASRILRKMTSDHQLILIHEGNKSRYRLPQ